MAFTTFRLLLIGNVYRPSITFPNIISFFSVRQIKSIILSIIISLPLTVTLFSSNAQAKICGPLCKRIREAKEALANIEAKGEIGLDDRDMEELFNSIEALVNMTRLQTEALARTVVDEYTESMEKTFYELEEYTKTLDNLAELRIAQVDKATEARLTQVDRVTEARIRQTLDGIKDETLLLSQEMTKQIHAVDEAVKSSSSHISYEIQEATITASDELARLLGVTREEVDYLLASSEERLLHILSFASDEINDLVKGISEETQKNINLGFDRAEKLTILGFDEFEESTHVIDGYTPMEQFGGRAVPASDLYALGATLIHILTGTSPADLPQQNMRIQFRKYLSISSPIINWIDKLTAPSVEQRFPTSRQALLALTNPEVIEQKSLILSKSHNSRIRLTKSPDKLEIKLPRRKFRKTDILLIFWIVILCGATIPFSLIAFPFVILFWLIGLVPISFFLLPILTQVKFNFDPNKFIFQWRVLGIPCFFIKGSTFMIQKVYAKTDNSLKLNDKPLIRLEIKTKNKTYQFGGIFTPINTSERRWLIQELKTWLGLN